MGAETILRNTGLLAASGLLALALAAVPVAPGLDSGPLGLKAAHAQGNSGGNGGGNGNGGNAGGQGNGQGNGVSTENHGLGAENHGVTASAMKGLNASHASIQGFAHASDDSMVGAIRSVIQDAYDEEAEGLVDDGMISTSDPDELKDGDEDLAEALAGILGVEKPELNPASTEVVDGVKGLVDDKVEVPSEDPVITEETDDPDDSEDT